MLKLFCTEDSLHPTVQYWMIKLQFSTSRRMDKARSGFMPALASSVMASWPGKENEIDEWECRLVFKSSNISKRSRAPEIHWSTTCHLWDKSIQISKRASPLGITTGSLRRIWLLTSDSTSTPRMAKANDHCIISGLNRKKTT